MAKKISFFLSPLEFYAFFPFISQEVAYTHIYMCVYTSEFETEWWIYDDVFSKCLAFTQEKMAPDAGRWMGCIEYQGEKIRMN